MIAAQFTDPENARIIFFAAGGLLVIAIGLVVATILWWRSSGIEPTALAPLEVMSTRQWWDSDEDARREQVQAVRGLADLRAGPPEAGQIVERAGNLSGVSLVGSGGAADFVDDDVLDDEYDDYEFDQAGYGHHGADHEYGDDHDEADDDGRPDAGVAAETAAPARRGYRRASTNVPERAGLDRLAQLDAETAPAAPAAPAPARRAGAADPVGLADLAGLAGKPQPGAAGLFDQFADDPFSDSEPPAPPARPRRAAAQSSDGQAAPRQPVAKLPSEIEDDLWGGSTAQRRSIDPLLDNRDSW